ncbi:MAG TPA: LacI family DNA-binding transcriptional regulator [Capsulimonadaceae bacterium]|jgi:LacI family transcriptional regulator
MKHATIIDIARHCGTDTGTVSRILAGKAAAYRISKKRAELVERTATELGYVPNASAQAFRTGRFGCAAMLMSDDVRCSYITPHMIYGIDDALAERDMHLVVSKVMAVLPDAESGIPRILRKSMVDGVLINYTHQVPEYLVDRIAERHLPMVWLNTRRDTNAVYMDNVDGARKLTEHLVSLGHTRIDYIDPYEAPIEDEHHSRRDRVEGYTVAMHAAGLSPRIWRPTGMPGYRQEAEPLVKEVLNRPDRPTAIISYWFNCVPTIFREAASLGLRVPEDLSVTTFGPERMEGLDLRVSAMLEQTYHLGTASVEMLCQIIDGQNEAPPSRMLPFMHLDCGTTTIAPPKRS